MTIEAKLNAALAGLVGGRLYPNLAPEAAAVPYIVFQQVGGAAVTYERDEVVNLRNGRFQIAVWSDRYQEAVSISQQAEAALITTADLQARPIGALVARVEANPRRHGAMQDFTIWDRR